MFSCFKHTIALLSFLLLACINKVAGQELPVYDISFPEPTTSRTVRHVERDENGFIWIATPMGVERYDGRNFIPYHLSDSRERSITEGFMTKIKSYYGTIWTSTERGVVTRYDASVDGFRYAFRTAKNDIWASGNYFFPTDYGFLIGTTNGLLPYYLNGDSIGDFSHTELNIRSITEHPDGRHLFICTMKGLFIFDPVADVLEPFSSIRAEINRIFVDKRNKCLWVGTQGSGLYLVDYENPLQTHLVSSTENKIFNIITPLNEDILLLGTDGDGLLATFYENLRDVNGLLTDCKFHLLASESPAAPCRLTNSVVDDIVVDGENIWLALSLGGMALMRPVNQKNLLRNPEAISYADGFAFGGNVDKNGDYWVAFSRSLVHYKGLGSEPEIISYPGMGNLCMITASDGTIWMGGYNTGLHHYFPATKQHDYYPSVCGQSVIDCVYAIHEDVKHDIWVGGMNFPLTCMHFKKDGSYDPKSYDIVMISDIAELNADTLVVTTFDSFYLLNIHSGEMQRLLTGYDGIYEWESTNAMASVATRHGHEIWFATQGAGIVFFDAHTGQVEKYGLDDVFPSLELCGIEFINDSILCCSTDHNGLFTFNANTRKAIRSINYVPSGKSKGVFMRGASGSDHNGHIVFGTDNGAIVVTEEDITAPQDTFRIVAKGDNYNDGYVLLPPDSHSLFLQFTTTDIYHQGEYAFEYRIKGLIEDWQPIGDTRTLRYQQIDPGDYVIEVRSNSASSYIVGIEIPLIVQSVIWLRWYFLLLYAVLIISFLFFMLHHYQLKRLSEIDGLTGIYNRYSGQRRIMDLIKYHHAGVFVLVDCDRFKVVNDTYGHNTGDTLIKEIAAALKTTFPDQITLRLGGDEFAFYLQGNYTPETLQPEIDRLFAAIKAIRINEIQDYTASISAGASFYDGTTDQSFENLYTEADNRLYESKKYRNFHITMA